MNFNESNQPNTTIAPENLALAPKSSTAYGLEELPQHSQGNSRQLVFIDSTVEDRQTLIDQMTGATEVVVLDDNGDKLLEISQHLREYQQLDAVHIVSHGQSGQLLFGNSELSQDTLPKYDKLLEAWGESLSADADLLFYGCNIAQGEKGNALIEHLSQITRADILASVDDTGKGGNWELEAAIAEIETPSIFRGEIEQVYQHVLAPGDITISSETLPDFNPVDFSGTDFDFTEVPADDVVEFAQSDLDFNTVPDETLTNIDFAEVPSEDLEILADAGLDYSILTPQEISNVDFGEVPSEDLEVLAAEGLNFSLLEPQDLEEITFSSVPAEDLSVLANAGLNFAQVDEAAIGNINYAEVPTEDLSVLANAGLDYSLLDLEAKADVGTRYLKGAACFLLTPALRTFKLAKICWLHKQGRGLVVL